VNRKHALGISSLLGVAVAAGALAATRGGAADNAGTAGVTDRAIARQNARLNQYEASLDELIASATGEAGGAPAPAVPRAVAGSGGGDEESWSEDENGESADYEDDLGDLERGGDD
jgi:hypothetical protein